MDATDEETSTVTYSVAGAWASNFQVYGNGSVYQLNALDRDYPEGQDNWQVRGT